MTTPKKRRLRERQQPDPDGFARFQPVLLDNEFDEMDQANAEWAAWKWPRRGDE